MNKYFRVVKKCRICKSSRLYKFLDLNKMPIPNGFRKKEDLKKREHKYELGCYFCNNCGLVQLTIVVNPEIMFKNYLYFSSMTKVMMNNFSSLAFEANEIKNLDENSLVIDIGSNDGSLLKFFKSYDSKVIGVDPAENVAKVAELNGIPTEIDYFNLSTAKRIRKKFGQADVITATNVIAHTDNLHSLFKGIGVLLKKNGIFITEFPYLVDLIDKLEFDTIYHEHLSYFSLRPWIYLIEKCGFEICDIRRLSIHGGSIRITHRKKNKNLNNSATKTLQFLLDLEKSKGLDKKETYDEFSLKVNNLKQELMSLLIAFKKDGKKIVGCGAAAKGNVLTNFFGIDTKILDFITDGNTAKQGLFTPGTNIPIFSESRLLKKMPDYALILAWNFANEIMEKQKVYFSKGGRFVIPLPEIKII